MSDMRYLFEIEFLDPLLIGSNGRTLDADVVFENSFGALDGHLIIGGVPVLNPQIKEVELSVDERKDEFLFE